MKNILYLILTVAFGIITLIKGMETITSLYNLDIIDALIKGVVTYCGYTLMIRFAKELDIKL